MVATLALVLAVAGGSAVAAGKIGPKQLKKSAVTSPKIKTGAVTTKKIAAGAVTGDSLSADAVARKFPNLLRVQQTSTGTSGGVNCPSGMKVISGGAQAVAGELVGSAPKAGAEGWDSNASVGTTSLTTFALCVGP